MRRLLRKFATALAARWRVGLLALVTTLIWCAHYDRWTLESWSIPTDYRGDSLEVLARIQASAEGDTVPLRPQMISRLGAPFRANWSAYPASDPLLTWLLGRVARGVGVFATANLAMVLATVTAALAFYGCARWLRFRWEWAFTLALLFAFTFQTFNRGLPHMFFLFSWTVPLALLTAALVAGGRRLEFPGWQAGFCLVTAAFIGFGNPYVLFLFLQLLGWALIVQWFGPKRRANLIIGLAGIAAAIACFVIAEAHVWLFAPDTAAASPLVRNYGGTEMYALKPIELFLPPSSHRWEAFSFFGHRYLRWAAWRGSEAFAPYLGLVGIIGFVWLAAAGLRALFQRRRVPGAALSTGWVLAFSSVGGVTNIVAFFTGLILFRATNRFSVFISAAVFLFLASRMTRWWRGRPAWASMSVAALVAVIGLADQLPRGPGMERQRSIARRISSDRELGRMLEGQLPPNAMIFQAPVMMFPEVVPPHQLTDYEYFRPYLTTHSLRFNYGTLKGRSRGRWQRDLEALAPAELVKRLEHYGFSALYFNRRAYADGGQKVLTDLAALGRTRVIEGQQHDHVVVLLEPNPTPKLPVARSLTFGRGWHNVPPGEPRWAYGPAALSYFNPYERPVNAALRLSLSGVGERNLAIQLNRKKEFKVQLGDQPKDVLLNVTLQPGINRLDLTTRERPVRLSNHSGQLRSFAIHRSNVVLEHSAEAGVVTIANE